GKTPALGLWGLLTRRRGQTRGHELAVELFQQGLEPPEHLIGGFELIRTRELLELGGRGSPGRGAYCGNRALHRMCREAERVRIAAPECSLDAAKRCRHIGSKHA